MSSLAEIRTALGVLTQLGESRSPQARREIAHVRSILSVQYEAGTRPPQPGEMGCYAISDDDRFACTRGFGHDGDHVAHGDGNRVVETWERKATDRFGSEAE